LLQASLDYENKVGPAYDEQARYLYEKGRVIDWLTADSRSQTQHEAELRIPHCANCRMLTRLLREARDRIPDWETGVNRELIAEIDAALELVHK